MAKRFDIEKFNRILENNKQILRTQEITSRRIVLSNGLILVSEKDVRLCKRRVMSGADVWKKNFDNLYSINEEVRVIAEKECRSSTSIAGGVSCQKKHKDTIFQNLNTGVPWNKGTKGNYPYSHSCSKETKQKISEANQGNKNGMFGKNMTTNQKEYRSSLMKERIKSGEFTPNSNNRNTHWDSYYAGKKFRSSWEAMYMFWEPASCYEELRIPYIYNGKEYIYIVDFINHKNAEVIEVKPKSQCKSDKFNAKKHAVENWCKENGYEYVIVTEDYFKSVGKPALLSGFDEKTKIKIEKFYETCK